MDTFFSQESARFNSNSGPSSLFWRGSSKGEKGERLRPKHGHLGCQTNLLSSTALCFGCAESQSNGSFVPFSPPSLTIAFASLSEVQNCHVLSLFLRCGDGLWLCCATIRPYLLARSCCSAKLPHRSGPHYTEYPDVVVNSGIGTHKSWCNRDAYPKVLQNKVHEYRVDIGLPLPSSIPGTECSSQNSRKVYRRD